MAKQKEKRSWYVYFKLPKARKYQQLKYPSNVITNPRMNLSRGNYLMAINYSLIHRPYTKINALRRAFRLKRQGFKVKIQHISGERIEI